MIKSFLLFKSNILVLTSWLKYVKSSLPELTKLNYLMKNLKIESYQ